MASTQGLTLNYTNTTAGEPQSMYVSPAKSGTLITAFTAANNSAANTTYSAYITRAGEVPENPQRPYRVVVWGEIDLGAGLVGQVIPNGGTLHVEVGDLSAVYFTLSGKELS